MRKGKKAGRFEGVWNRQTEEIYPDLDIREFGKNPAGVYVNY